MQGKRSVPDYERTVDAKPTTDRAAIPPELVLRPIVRDKARAQRWAHAQPLAQWPGCEVPGLPPYSPALHPLERCWHGARDRVTVLPRG